MLFVGEIEIKNNDLSAIFVVFYSHEIVLSKRYRTVLSGLRNGF
jgi:hypothetical protein